MKIRLRTVRIRDGILFENFSEALLAEVFQATSVANPEYESVTRYSRWAPSVNLSPTIDFASYTETGLHAPRGVLSFLPQELRTRLTPQRVLDTRVSVPVEFPKLRLSLNTEQAACHTELERVLRNNLRPYGNLLFLASTSAGKTILQASVAARLGQRTLILCPTDQIMRSWYADLYKAYGLNNRSIGLIRGKSFSIGKAFTVATPHTLVRRADRWDEINAAFGTIVVDETQIVTAPQLFRFLEQSPAKYLVGATATQEARKGINYHLKVLFGEPVISLNTYGTNTATSMSLTGVFVVESPFRFTHQADNIDWYQLGMAMTSDEERNQLIVENVVREWSGGRVVLIATKLREHVSVLEAMLVEAGVTNVNCITGETNAQDFYTKSLLRRISEGKATCIIATQQAIKIGANIPRLDSLHVAIPPANARDLEQLIGRIRRKAEGKKEATLTYYLDTKVGYLMHLFNRVVRPVFMKLELPGFQFTSKQ